VNDATLLSARVAAINAKSLSVQFPAPDSVNPSDTADTSRQPKSTQPLTDSEREAAIVQAGKAIEHYMAEYERTGCFGARGDADRSRRLMELLIRGRSPEQVARMERERGLA
jgi:hypothetical protein